MIEFLVLIKNVEMKKANILITKTKDIRQEKIMIRSICFRTINFIMTLYTIDKIV